MRKLVSSICLVLSLIFLFSCKKPNNSVLPPSNNIDTTTKNTIPLSYWTTYDIRDFLIEVYWEDTVKLAPYTAKWDNTTNSLICEGDSNNNDVTKISVSFLQRPTSTKTYLMKNPHWNGPLTDTNTCNVTLEYINPVQSPAIYQSSDSGYYIQVAVINNKISIALRPTNVTYVGNPHPLLPLEGYISNGIYDLNLTGQLYEK